MAATFVAARAAIDAAVIVWMVVEMHQS